MTLNHMLYEATMEVLEGLGEEVMQSLVWQIEMRGVALSLDSFNIKLFADALRELFGDGANSLMEEIYQNAICRLELIRPTTSDNYYTNSTTGDEVMSNPLEKLLILFGDAQANDGRPEDKD